MSENPFKLDHSVALHVPSNCMCGKPIPENLRMAALQDVLKQLSKWYNGAFKSESEGIWLDPGGSVHQEPVTIITSCCTAEKLEEHFEDAQQLAVVLANRLSQYCVTLQFDGKMAFFNRTDEGPCVHQTAPLPRQTDDQQRKFAIHVALGAFDSITAARDFFCGVLNYTYMDGHIPTFQWPKDLTDRLREAPRIVSDTNGFKIAHLALRSEILSRADERKIIERVYKDDPGFRGLFVVSNSSGEDWEFVNVKFVAGQASKPVLRRFAVGRAENVRTATERLALVDLHGREHLSAAEIQTLHDEAFDVETVTKNFYKDYAAVFAKTEELLPAELKGDERRLFAQMLFNRLMFLRFIERKGWLTFRGSENYLQELLAAGPIGRKSLYRSRICTLFFEGLGKEGYKEDDIIGKVPFLNGGLFERSDLDKKIKDLDDRVWEPIIGRNGLLYRYNFTITESTPLDVEVAVDPEMLGKVFEELVTGRHESGSYYTPRPVVAFMCREALKGYLADKTDCDDKTIAAIVDEHSVKELTAAHANQIIKSLEGLKAVDPACGSGAYLLGLLQELLALYQLLLSEKVVGDSRSLYDLKLHIISNNLYGADLDRFAVNIAMLRLWLSLSVDSEKPVSLPNLDFKIECGDSLLGPDPQLTDIFLVNYFESQAEGIQKMKDKYLKAHGSKKIDLYQEVLRREKKIAKQLSEAREGAMHWRLHFAEAFLTNRGFDVVLANPPYVRHELINDIKPQLKETYPEVYAGTADLYCYFYARALQLLRPGGMLVFISSNKWFRAKYGDNLRKHVADRCRVLSITDFGDLPVFESATAYPMIFVAQRRTTEAPRTEVATVYTEVSSLDPPYPDVLAIIKEHGGSLPKNSLAGKLWNLARSSAAAQFRKMEENGVTLGEYVQGRIYYGIKTGFNEAFVIDGEKRAELISQDCQCSELIKPLVMGKDIRKWHIERKDKWLIVTKIGVSIKRYPAILGHLKGYKNRLERRSDQGDSWYELRACAYYDEFEKPKIVYPDIALEPRFAHTEKGEYLGNTGYIIPVDDFFLLGILNSKSVKEYYSSISPSIRGGYYRFIYQYMVRIPVPKCTNAQRSEISTLAKKCIRAKEVERESLEREIDERAAVLYGL